MPSKQRSAEVGGTEGIEAAAEDAACDTVEGGEVPAYLRLVYRKMGGDGAVAALGFEDVVCIEALDSLGCGRSGRGWSQWDR